MSHASLEGPFEMDFHFQLLALCLFPSLYVCKHYSSTYVWNLLFETEASWAVALDASVLIQPAALAVILSYIRTTQQPIMPLGLSIPLSKDRCTHHGHIGNLITWTKYATYLYNGVR